MLALHRTFAGWTADDGKIRTLHLTGKEFRLQKDGSELDLFTIEELRNGIFFKQSIVSVQSGSGNTSGFSPSSSGPRFWNSTFNGFVVPDLSDSRAAVLARRIVFGEANGGLPTTLRPSATVNGIATKVLRQTPPSGKPFDLYIDPETGAYKRLVYDPEGTNSTVIDIDAYAEAQLGKRVVSAWHYDGSSVRTRYDTIKANVALAADALQPPTPKARWTFGHGEPVSIDTRHDSIRVRATVNGHGGLFELDTGAHSIAFTEGFADRAGLKRQRAVNIYGVASGNAPRVRGAIVHVDTLSFPDGSKLENVDAISGLVSLSSEPEVDGLLGFDFLGGAIVDVDFDKSHLTIYDPKTNSVNDAGGVIVLPDLTSGQPAVPVKIDGRFESHAILDTGGAAPVLIPHTLSSRLSMLAVPKYAIGGVTGGYEVDACGVLSSIEIGRITWQNPGACYSGSVGTDESLIGFDFLKNFNMTFDYPDGKIVMTKRASS
ncbi:MAG: retroviral-like aspartic protease family protein [Candidatus Eremiobacteraeota bacterium]|nr:retroviral-like aspartic protease family protein [Candidatus Eremiobacteraeota bacterium]